MAHHASAPTVGAVVAAYDEEERLAAVLETLVTFPGFDEVLVVDDGSTDRTAEIARRYTRCLSLPENRGKGAALEAGVRQVGTDVLFFADADIRDLDHETIAAVLAPVVAGEVDMFVAMRHRSIYHVRSVLRFLPLLGGERAVSAKLWHAVPDRYKERFKIEAALNFYACHHGRGLRYRVFPIRQTPKEVKHGLVRGLGRRARMTADVAAAIVEVQRVEAPADARDRRRAAATAAVGTVGLVHAVRRRARPATRSSATATAARFGWSAAAVTSGVVVASQLVRLVQTSERCGG